MFEKDECTVKKMEITFHKFNEILDVTFQSSRPSSVHFYKNMWVFIDLIKLCQENYEEKKDDIQRFFKEIQEMKGPGGLSVVKLNKLYQTKNP